MDATRRDLLMRDRSWMNYKNASDRRKPDYVDGVNAFLDFAFSNAGNNEKIRCPCVNCFLGSFHDRKTVFYHLLARGILKDYNPWTQHGEDEIEEESIPYEDHMPIAHEVHLPIPLQAKNVSDSREEKVEDGDIQQQQKEKRNVHQENDEDGGDSPIIPPNVWRYVTAIGMSKSGKICSLFSALNSSHFCYFSWCANLSLVYFFLSEQILISISYVTPCQISDFSSSFL